MKRERTFLVAYLNNIIKILRGLRFIKKEQAKDKQHFIPV